MSQENPNDPYTQSFPYEHARFPVGTRVYIDPAIRAIYPEHYGADQTGTVCANVYYPLLESLGQRSYASYVPVLLASGRVSPVEEEYVFAEVTE